MTQDDMQEQRWEETYEDEYQEAQSPEAAEPTAEGQDSSDRRLVYVLGAALGLVVLCLCLSLALNAGLGLRGDQPGPTPIIPPEATVAPSDTPEPTATPVPTPEPGEPPVAVVDAPSRAVVGQEIVFDGSNSTAAVPLVVYAWDFGDGTRLQGAIVRHTYTVPGDYIITLTVVDQNELSDDASLRVIVNEPEPTPAAPEAQINAPSEANVGEVVTFDGRESTSGNPIVNYAWDFGDRTQGAGALVDHVYNQPGTYIVSLAVTDNTGQTGTNQVEITINEVAQTPPTGVIDGPAEALVGEEVTFSAANSEPGSSEIVNYAWDFGNGNTQEGGREVEVTTRYDTPGQYQVTLTVTDANGLSGATVTTIIVNAPLEGTSWYLTTVLPGTEISAQFDGGQVTGSSGCNTYTGNYALSDSSPTGGSLIISDISATRLSCPEDVMAQEERYLSLVQTATSYAIQINALTITTAEGTLTFSDQPPS